MHRYEPFFASFLHHLVSLLEWIIAKNTKEICYFSFLHFTLYFIPNTGEKLYTFALYPIVVENHRVCQYVCP